MANAAGSKADDKAAGPEGAQASPVNPLMMHPAAAFAAATAIGFGFQTQMASAFFGAMQNMVDAGHKFSAMLEKQKLEAKVATPGSASVETPAVVPVAKVETAVMPEAVAEKTDNVVTLKPLARKVAEPVPVLAKAEVKAKAEPQPEAEVKPKAEAKPKIEPKRKAEVAPVAEIATAEVPVVEARQEKQAAAAKSVRTKADDLKRIAGIGPKLEQVLNGMGITRFADIVGWSEDDMKRIDAELGFAGRIGRDDWIGQAKVLAGARAGKK